MRFQDRDARMLMAIFENDGVMAKRQVKQLFWPGRSWRAMEQRLSKLYQAEYIRWPDTRQQKNNPIPEPICWLGWKGALFIAGACGIVVEPPKSANENQLRLLQKRFRDQGIRWMREPRWSVLAHDLAVIDLRLVLEKSIQELPGYSLEKWLPEGEFRSNMDVVQFNAQTRDGRTIRMKRGVCPDAYFEIVDEGLKASGKPHKARFLMEMDMATHDNPSFGKYKALPGVAYIKSAAYKERFGNNHGLWLIVTSGGERRLNNLIRQTEERVGKDARLFFSSTTDEMKGQNFLVSPIWHQAGSNQTLPLIPNTDKATFIRR